MNSKTNSSHIITISMRTFICFLRLSQYKLKEFFADKIRMGWFKNRVRRIENYVWSFQPTFLCNFQCSYCIQKFGTKDIPIQATPVDSIELDRFLSLNKLNYIVNCLVIQGGEPLLAKGLDQLISKFTKFRKILIISNFSVDLQNFIELKDRIAFELKFIGSFHPEFCDLAQFIDKAIELKKNKMLQYCCMVDRGWRVNLHYLKKFLEKGIKFVIYSRTGVKNNRLNPTKARYACNGLRRKVLCKTDMVLISPNGKVFNCHTKMYMDKDELCNIDNINDFSSGFLECNDFGICHPCQIDDFYIKHR